MKSAKVDWTIGDGSAITAPLACRQGPTSGASSQPVGCFQILSNGRSASLRPAPSTAMSFRFIDLPAELRIVVYDEFLERCGGLITLHAHSAPEPDGGCFDVSILARLYNDLQGGSSGTLWHEYLLRVTTPAHAREQCT